MKIRLSFLKEFLNSFEEWRLQFLGWSIYFSAITIFIILNMDWRRIATHAWTTEVSLYAVIYILFIYPPFLNVLRDALTEEAKRSIGCRIFFGFLGLVPLLFFLLGVIAYWIIF